eukprot:SAG31_NODE_2393_length_5793_cov_18.326484_3_plen_213_part_00
MLGNRLRRSGRSLLNSSWMLRWSTSLTRAKALCVALLRNSIYICNSPLCCICATAHYVAYIFTLSQQPIMGARSYLRNRNHQNVVAYDLPLLLLLLNVSNLAAPPEHCRLTIIAGLDRARVSSAMPLAGSLATTPSSLAHRSAVCPSVCLSHIPPCPFAPYQLEFRGSGATGEPATLQWPKSCQASVQQQSKSGKVCRRKWLRGSLVTEGSQ